MPNTIFHSKPICTNTWLIQGDGSNSYLVVGDKQGVVDRHRIRHRKYPAVCPNINR